MAETTDPEQPAGSPQKEPGPLLLTVAVWFLTTLIVGAAILYGLSALATTSSKPWRKLDSTEYYDLARSTVALTALLGAAVAAGLAIRRQRSQERAVTIASETQQITASTYALERKRADQELMRGLRDRYREAAEQLGSSAAAVRLAGVYAMASLADDWTERSADGADAQSCIDVLCAFLRTPAQVPRDAQGQPSSGESIAGDREVRRTISRVVAAHLRAEATVSWSPRNFDLTGATFDFDVDFSRCIFRGDVSFAKATFSSGIFELSGAKFLKREVAPDAAHLPDRNVSFKGATVASPVNLTSVELERTLQFDEAVFAAGKLNLRQLMLIGSAGLQFREAKFQGADVLIPELQVKPSNRVAFVQCIMNAGKLDMANGTIYPDAKVSLEGFRLAGGVLTFAESRVQGALRLLAIDQSSTPGRLILDEMTISQGSVQISHSNLVGSKCSFVATRFEDGGSCSVSDTTIDEPLPGPWSPAQMPDRWPTRDN